jgi:hypothetical protein
MVVLVPLDHDRALLAGRCLTHYAQMLEQQLPLMPGTSVPHVWQLVGQEAPEHPLSFPNPGDVAAGVRGLAAALLEAQEPVTVPPAVNEDGAPAVAAVDGLPRPPSEQPDPKDPPPAAPPPDAPLVAP